MRLAEPANTVTPAHNAETPQPPTQYLHSDILQHCPQRFIANVNRAKVRIEAYIPRLVQIPLQVSLAYNASALAGVPLMWTHKVQGNLLTSFPAGSAKANYV